MSWEPEAEQAPAPDPHIVFRESAAQPAAATTTSAPLSADGPDPFVAVAERPPEELPHPPSTSAPPSDMAGILTAIEQSKEIAVEARRADLGHHLDRAQRQLTERPIPVVVCGEYKRGKSTLINALLQTDVCPVDEDIVTAVPTTVCYADPARVRTFARADDSSESDHAEADFADLAQLVTERTPLPGRHRSVEVGIPHRMLISGMALIDTPGVGGLESADGYLTLGAMRETQAAIFVTDASQELTEPELAFLRVAAERCPRICLVMTKIDLHPHWRAIVELDAAHLHRAGLSMPIIALSSFLRLRAAKDPQLNAESGFGPLVAFLARDVVAHVRSEMTRQAAHEVEFVAAQLDQKAQAEQAILADPEQGERLVTALDEAKEHAKQLGAANATWQKTLADGIEDLVADIGFDLQHRFRQLLLDAEEVIDAGDPRDTWSDVESWLRRQVAVVTVANRDLLVDRTQALAEEVADQFDLQAGAAEAAAHLRTVGGDVDTIKLAALSNLMVPGGRLAPLIAGVRSGYLPIVLGNVLAATLAGGVLAHVAIVGAAVVLGTGIGKKIISDERQRQRTHRQQQAKAAVRKFVDDVAFMISKESQDGLRATRRHLRDDFEGRAQVLQRSAAEAAAAAQRLADLDPAAQRAHRRELEAQTQQLDQVRDLARELADAGSS